jgi:hypothetical protein
MSTIRKDHSIGAGTGAVAGSVAGATVGAVAGPVGMAAGAVVGAVLGAAAGDGVAEAMNPTTYGDYWKKNYESRPYFVSGRAWTDYEPAYQYGYSAFGAHRGRTFADIESDLQGKWDATRGNSRLAWAEAKEAVRDGWHYVERAMPGDADGDGR